ncbi:hypothetical protein TNCV_735341 [Trichonephila clavipes]|uniref:Uncharacterized protein n=1 Tax=Trichonephila clavipes TaxID=2585209 RepID=A0A8X6VQN2_TRICX|nr:hypothetical protein TNCV_735341 [Trichonephila clavipes]
MVTFWAAEFKRGNKSLGDDECSGRPNTATTNENIAKVHQMVLDDHRIKWYWDRTHDMPAMVGYLNHWATAAP